MFRSGIKLNGERSKQLYLEYRIQLGIDCGVSQHTDELFGNGNQYVERLYGYVGT